LVLGVLIVGAGACTSPTEYGRDGLRATVSPPQLTLTNTSEKRIAYILVERDYAARVTFACLSPDSHVLAPSGELSLLYSSIPGYEAGKSTEALVWFAPFTDADVGCIDEARRKTLVVKL
jgi:hypothetical protein